MNRGNILLQIGEPNQIDYIFEGFSKSVQTFGHLVVFIDFQRSSLVEDSDEHEYKIIQASDEISLAYELMKKWTKSEVYKTALHLLMMNVMKITSLEELIEVIDNFSVD